MKFIGVLLMGIAFSFPVWAADSPTTPKQETSGGEIQVPTQLSGTVSPLSGVDFCMDGATHLIHTPIGIFRLKGRNAETTKALTSAADGKKKVSVMGYPVSGPECNHISVYSVSEKMVLLK